MPKCLKKEPHVPYGPLAKHGGYSIAHKAELLQRRPEIQQYLKTVRRDLIRDLAPEGEIHLSAARRIILDRLFSKLSTVRLLEAWLAENPAQILEAVAATGLWLSTNTAILKDLLALGLDRKVLEAEATPLDAILADYAPGGRLAGPAVPSGAPEEAGGGEGESK